MIEQMFETNKTYRFTLTGEDYYTGEVILEDANMIKIKSIKNEIVVILKTNILKAKEMRENGDTGRIY